MLQYRGILFLLIAMTVPRIVSAQDVAQAPQVPSHPYFEFQVDKRVRQVADSGGLIYPVTLRAQGIEGEVLAQFIVDDSGHYEARSFKVLKSSHVLFTQSVKDALPTLRFTPAELGGKKVRQLVMQPFTFSLSAHVKNVLVPMPGVARDSISFDRFEPDVPPVDGPFECSARDRLGAGATTVSASFPSVADVRATVRVTIDSTGKIVRYAERRGPPIQPTIAPGSTSVEATAAIVAAAEAVRATTITLDYSVGRAIISNRGGGRPAQSVSVLIGAATWQDKLGSPLDRAARVVSQCDRAR